MKVTGSLQEKNGIYQMIVRVPDINGNLKQKSKSTRIKIQGKNKRETTANKHKADLMLAEWMETLSQTESYGADKDLIEAIEDWLAMKKKQIRPNSYESYLNTYEVHVKPYFEKKKLKLGDVTARVVMQYVRTKEDAGLSRKSIRKHLVILNGVFTEAIAMGELNYNPCANITVKDNRDDHFEGTAYDIATAKKLLEAVKGDPIEPAVHLGGKRHRPYPQHRRPFCNNFGAGKDQEQGQQARSVHAERTQRVFADGLGSAGRGTQARRAQLFRYRDLPHIRFHDLRHTAGSMLVNQGHTIKQVQEFLGHEKASTTLDIYTHVSMEGKKDTADVLDLLLA